MLQRIYGTAFTNKAELDAYLARMEEAKKRDHRKLGRELDLFDIRGRGPRLPLLLPQGHDPAQHVWKTTGARFTAKQAMRRSRRPIMLNRALWERSGHWDHYKENMYTTKIDDEDFAIKPMNCPGGMLVYKRKPM